MTHKKQIALRLNPSLVKQLDHIRPHTQFHTRTEFIETACSTYIAFLQYQLEAEALSR